MGVGASKGAGKRASAAGRCTPNLQQQQQQRLGVSCEADTLLASLACGAEPETGMSEPGRCSLAAVRQTCCIGAGQTLDQSAWPVLGAAGMVCITSIGSAWCNKQSGPQSCAACSSGSHRCCRTWGCPPAARQRPFQAVSNHSCMPLQCTLPILDAVRILMLSEE